MEVSIVTKHRPATYIEKGKEIKGEYITNEGVFATDDEAREYIEKRKAAKDRDDRGCTFEIEWWNLDLSRSNYDVTYKGIEETELSLE